MAARSSRPSWLAWFCYGHVSESLRRRRSGSGLVALDDGAVLVTEALSERRSEHRSRDDWRSIGQTLARLHQVHDAQFGLEHLNGFFGALRQDNTPVSSNRWVD